MLEKVLAKVFKDDALALIRFIMGEQLEEQLGNRLARRLRTEQHEVVCVEERGTDERNLFVWKWFF